MQIASKQVWVSVLAAKLTQATTEAGFPSKVALKP
jgi:hypothetical protein